MAATVIHLATASPEDTEKQRVNLGASIALDLTLGITAAVMAYKANGCHHVSQQIGMTCFALVLPQLYLIQMAVKLKPETCG